MALSVRGSFLLVRHSHSGSLAANVVLTVSHPHSQATGVAVSQTADDVGNSNRSHALPLLAVDDAEIEAESRRGKVDTLIPHRAIGSHEN